MYTLPFRNTALVCETVFFGEPAGDHVAFVPAGRAAHEGRAIVAMSAAATVMIRTRRIIAVRTSFVGGARRSGRGDARRSRR
jgi:hypothetical protein